uniref:Uncharacterized protein n=1 Tax=Octopus bimaculoides TaxID=37653 RepID=A0A0L8H1Y0_OCTBM
MLKWTNFAANFFKKPNRIQTGTIFIKWCHNSTHRCYFRAGLFYLFNRVYKNHKELLLLICASVQHLTRESTLKITP